MEQNKPTTIKGFLRTLSVIHLSLFIGVALVIALLYMNTEVVLNTEGKEDIVAYVFPFLGLAGILASKYIFRLKMQSLKQEVSLSKMLPGYMTASLISYALVELPAFLNIIWFTTTGNMLYFAVVLALAIYLFWLRPTRGKIEVDLALKGRLLEEFRKNDRAPN